MVFLNGCLPNKVEESLTAEEPRAVSGFQLSASIRIHSLSGAIFLHKVRQNFKASRVYCTGKIRPKDTKWIFYCCFFPGTARPLTIGRYRHQKGRPSCQKKQNKASCTGIFSIKPAVSIGWVGHQHYRQKSNHRHNVWKCLPIIAEYFWPDIAIWWSSIKFSRPF